MPNSFIVFDAGKFTASVQGVSRNLDSLRARYVEALKKSMMGFAFETIAEAQQKAAVRSGDLKAAGVVQDPVVTQTEISVQAGFNIGYAKFRNDGGTIYPTRSKMLAIPLDPIMTGQGVSRYASPREEQGLFVLKLWGRAFLAKKTAKTIELHWVLKDHVTQKGDRFFTSVLEARKSRAAGEIAAATANAMGAA